MGHTIEFSYVPMKRRRYTEIRDLYIDQLASAWMEDSTTEITRAGVNEKINSFVEGDLEHATEVLSALWESVSKDGDITAPSNSLPTVSSLRFCPLPGVTWRRSLKQSGSAGSESRTLDPCEDCAHQVDSQRGLLRQEVLG